MKRRPTGLRKPPLLEQAEIPTKLVLSLTETELETEKSIRRRKL